MSTGPQNRSRLLNGLDISNLNYSGDRTHFKDIYPQTNIRQNRDIEDKDLLKVSYDCHVETLYRTVYIPLYGRRWRYLTLHKGWFKYTTVSDMTSVLEIFPPIPIYSSIPTSGLGSHDHRNMFSFSMSLESTVDLPSSSWGWSSVSPTVELQPEGRRSHTLLCKTTNSVADTIINTVGFDY